MRIRTNLRNTAVALLTATLLGGCGGGSGAPGATTFEYRYLMPRQSTDGWAVGDAASEGLDVDRLSTMMESIHNQGHDEFLRNILIAKQGNLVFEEYFGGTGIDSLSHLQSATKSIVSTIFSIAVSNGHIVSLDDPLFDYFPEYRQLNDADKQAITLRHVLSMTPGLDWNENSSPTFGSQNDNIAAYASNNYIEYVLQKPVVSTPGSAWNYNSGCPMLLAGIIRNQTGVHLDVYGRDQLFTPLGIQDWRWEYQADGLPLATGGLWLRARDTAKIGQLFLDGGLWNGLQVIPPAWIDEALTARIPADSSRDYGYLWWTRGLSGHRLWYAHGYGGQMIVLVPASDTLIVINASYTRDTAETGQRQNVVWNLLSQYILPAI